MKLTYFRVFLSIVASKYLKLDQMDVLTAFLNGHMKEVYMEQTREIEKGDSARVVCKLIKALYCLKQASRDQYAKIEEFFVVTSPRHRNKANKSMYICKDYCQALI